MTNLIIDSSFLYALYQKTEKHHAKALEFATKNKIQSYIPTIILTEVTFLFLRDVGHRGVEKFLIEFGKINPNLLELTLSDIQRATEIMGTYRSAELDLVDCCIMAFSERLKITQICTFDRRDFSIFRPKHCDYLELLP